MGNVEGKATAITVLTPVEREGPLVLLAVFWAGRHIKETLKKLEQLSFIHYARWAVIDRVPNEGHGEELNHEYLLFESNFNGTWDQYIDAFSEVVPLRMKAIWGTSYGFPGPLPVEPFKDYIRRNEYTANHYYSAYPEATATTILGALELAPKVADLRERASTMSPESFKAAWDSLITEMQSCL